MIKLNNITKKYKDKTVLNGITYEFNDTGLYFILGKSGSGKTTLLNIISKNIEQSEGSITYNNINSIYEESYYIYQDFNLIPTLSVIDNIKLVLKIKKKEYDESKVLEKLRDVGLSELTHTKTRDLSGGERQRLSIVIGLILNSKVIFLDEPTSALDYELRDSIMSYLREISSTTLLIIATHDLSLIKEDDNVINLNDFQSNYIASNNCVVDLKTQKINLGLNTFYIKNKMMKKDTFRMFFQVLFITMLIISLSLVIPFSNLTYESVCAKELTNGSQNLLIQSYTENDFFNSYKLNYRYESLITLSNDDKNLKLYELFIDDTLNDDEIIISSYVEETLASSSLLNQEIYANSKAIKVIKVEEFKDIAHAQIDVIYDYAKVNYNTYVKIDDAYHDITINYYYDFEYDTSLEEGTCTVTQDYYDKYLNGHKVGDIITLDGHGALNSVQSISLRLVKIGDKNTMDKMSLYKLVNRCYWPTNSVNISNLTNYQQTKQLISYLKENKINFYFNNEISAYFVAQVFDGFDILLKVLIPILLIFSCFLTIYISYNMYKNNKRSFSVLSLLGVSKRSILSICLIDHIECIIVSILLSIYPCIAISNNFMNTLSNMDEYSKLNVSFTLFEGKYLCLFALLIFIILMIISVIFNLVRNTKRTYINE